MSTKRRAADEGTLYHDEARGLWVGQLPRSVDASRRKVYGATQAKVPMRRRAAIMQADPAAITR